MRQMKITSILLIMLTVCAVLAISGCTSNSPTASPPVGPTAAGAEYKVGLPDTLDYQITVTNGTNSPLTLTYKDLKAMDFSQIVDATTVNSAGTRTTGTYSGVPMMAILNKAGLPQGNLTFVVTASDGYTKFYSMDQMQKSILGLKVNDTAMTTNINDKAKSIRMIVPDETNDMWIKIPVNIDIQKA
jgi:DMSO/TMAO reductase YedYZ molybdopterin-dependent catalytic subunit